MNVSKSSAYTVQQWAEAAFWVLLVLLMVRAAYDALQPPETDEKTDHPDYAHLSALDLEALEDGEQRRIRTTDGQTLRLEGERIEGDDEE